MLTVAAEAASEAIPMEIDPPIGSHPAAAASLFPATDSSSASGPANISSLVPHIAQVPVPVAASSAAAHVDATSASTAIFSLPVASSDGLEYVPLVASVLEKLFAIPISDSVKTKLKYYLVDAKSADDDPLNRPLGWNQESADAAKARLGRRDHSYTHENKHVIRAHAHYANPPFTYNVKRAHSLYYRKSQVEFVLRHKLNVLAS